MAAFICGLALTPVVQAEPSASLNTKRFGNWELNCAAPDAPSQAHPNQQPGCRLSQRLAVKDTGQTVFALTIVRGDKKDSLVGVVSIPLGGYIAPGIEMRIDTKKSYKLLVETCNVSGCHAGFPIPAALLKEWSKAKELSFRIWTAKAKPADVAVMLSGFNDGLKALRENTN